VTSLSSFKELPSRQAAFVLIALLLTIKLALASSVPLVGDEAYYVLWSRVLSPGYYDHPPMVAFFIRGGTILFGETPLGVRFVPLLSGLATTGLVWLAADRAIMDARAGPVAATLYGASLFGFLGQAVATPDAPLTLFSAAMLYWGLRALQNGRAVDWLLLGGATGLAIESKYSALLLAMGLALAGLTIAPMRRHLTTPWPWLAAGLALVITLPNIVWNAQAGWATFAKQGGRLVTHGELGWHYVGEMVAAQLGLLTPIIFVFVIVGCLAQSRAQYRDAATRQAVLTAVAVPTGYFVFHSLRSRVEGNWPGFVYPGYAILACAGILSVSTASALRRLSGAAIPIALCVGLATAFVIGFAPLRWLGRTDPVLRLSRGWENLAADVEARRRATGASYVLTDNYQINAELSLHLPRVRIAQVDQRQRYRPLGEPENAVTPETALLISRSSRLSIDAPFRRLEALAPFTRQYDAHEIEKYQSQLLGGIAR
jgi:4-amino-4-deoxy-L-arabinose transferase-like glycosyltransferase